MPAFHRQNQGTQIGLRRSVCPYHRGRFLIPIIVLELVLKFSIPFHVSWQSPHFFPASILGEIKFYRNKRNTLRMDARFIYSNYAQWKVSISTNLIDILLWTWLGGKKKNTKGDFSSQLTLTKKRFCGFKNISFFSLISFPPLYDCCNDKTPPWITPRFGDGYSTPILCYGS